MLDPESDDYREALNHVASTRHITHWAAHQLFVTKELDPEVMLAEARAAKNASGGPRAAAGDSPADESPKIVSSSLATNP